MNFETVTIGRNQSQWVKLKKEGDGDTAILFIGGVMSPLWRYEAIISYFAEHYTTYGYEVSGLGDTKRVHPPKPTIAVLSDETAQFIREKITEPNIIIVAGSVGFWVISSMLLRNIDMQEKIKKIVSLVGIVGADTFTFSKPVKVLGRTISAIGRTWGAQRLIALLLSSERILTAYARTIMKKNRPIQGMTPAELQECEEQEKRLVRETDWHSYFTNVHEVFTANLFAEEKLTIPVYAVHGTHDQYFSLDTQKMTFSRIYSTVMWEPIALQTHSPSAVKDISTFRKLFDEEKLLRFLKQTE
jgi:pimeloyl-ACP methyl ester carboxylesterase